jgi:hypothetical protein
MKTRFREMLLNNQTLDMATQRTTFNNTLEEWINHPSEDPSQVSTTGQIDDIILIGVRI